MQCLENTQKTHELHLKLQPCVSMLKSMTNQTNQPTTTKKHYDGLYGIYGRAGEIFVPLKKVAQLRFGRLVR